jgi:hypothetical protein
MKTAEASTTEDTAAVAEHAATVGEQGAPVAPEKASSKSSELIRQVLFSENFWKPATVFHPKRVGSPRASDRSEPRLRRDRK